jgi:hypothetical protein
MLLKTYTARGAVPSAGNSMHLPKPPVSSDSPNSTFSSVPASMLSNATTVCVSAAWVSCCFLFFFSRRWDLQTTKS